MMKIAMKRLYIMFLAVFALSACEQALIDDVPETVEVVLSLSGTPLAKADSPLIPDMENLIYDVWILQYDKMGLLINAGTSHERKTNSGSLTATVTATLAVADGCTICVLANLDRGVPDAVRTWPQTLTDFKTSVDVVDLSADIAAANVGTLEDMPMSGYWEGDINSSKDNIQVSLGRMLARINLVINNVSSSTCTLESVSNVPFKVYAFPSVNHDPLPPDAYQPQLSINQSVAAGAAKELYYYVAPNFTAGEANATRLKIAGKPDVILSNGSPTDSPRDYNLYHNSNYTFTINIK